MTETETSGSESEKGTGGGGVTGGQGLQWGGMERGGRLRHTLFRRPEIHGEIDVAN